MILTNQHLETIATSRISLDNPLKSATTLTLDFDELNETLINHVVLNNLPMFLENVTELKIQASAFHYFVPRRENEPEAASSNLLQLFISLAPKLKALAIQVSMDTDRVDEAYDHDDLNFDTVGAGSNDFYLGMENLTAILPLCENLSSLSFHLPNANSDWISEWEDGLDESYVTEFLNAIPNNGKLINFNFDLETLPLGYKGVPEDSLKIALINVIQNHPLLIDLSLGFQFLGFHHEGDLAASITRHPALVSAKLDMSFGIEPSSIFYFFNQSNTLKKLSITVGRYSYDKEHNDRQYQNEEPGQIHDRLVTAIKKNTNLTHLDLSLEQDGDLPSKYQLAFKEPLKALLKSITLESLNFNVKVTPSLIQELSDYISKNEFLTNIKFHKSALDCNKLAENVATRNQNRINRFLHIKTKLAAYLNKTPSECSTPIIALLALNTVMLQALRRQDTTIGKKPSSALTPGENSLFSGHLLLGFFGMSETKIVKKTPLDIASQVAEYLTKPDLRNISCVSGGAFFSSQKNTQKLQFISSPTDEGANLAITDDSSQFGQEAKKRVREPQQDISLPSEKDKKMRCI